MRSISRLVAAGLVLVSAPFAAEATSYEYSTSHQKNLSRIGVTPDLHSRVTGAGTGIAVFDSLADFTHIDLAGNTTSYLPYAGTYTRFDFHGTHVSGIAGAQANGTGIVGVAPGARIHNYAVFDDKGWVAGDLGRTALNHVRTQNAGGANIKVVNMSYGPLARGDIFLNGELTLFSGYKNDFVIVRAAGNDGAGAIHEPFSGTASTALSHLLIVGSVDENNNLSSFSNRPGNACIAARTTCTASERISNFFIVAPGRDILSDYPGQQLAFASGTSMAAPHVAGAVALVAEDGMRKNVALTPTQIATIIKKSATDLGAKGVDAVYGWGLLNVTAALAPVGSTTVATGSTVTAPKAPAPAPKFKLPFFSKRGVGSSGLFSGIVVFDEFGRPFEADPAAFAEPSSRKLSALGLSMLGLMSRQQTVDFDDGDKAAFGWRATGVDGNVTSALHVVAEDYEMSVGIGAPELFLTETPSANRAARPQHFPQIMFSSLGEAAALFNNAVSMNFRAPLTGRLDGTFFGVTATDGTPDPYAPTLLDNDGRTGNESHFAAVGLSYRLAETWSLGASYGALHENGSVAGIEGSGAFSLGERALTQFQGVNLTGDISPNYSLALFYTRASIESSGTSASLFDEANGWGADHFGARLTARDVIRDASVLRLSFIKPLQIKDGAASVRVPVGRELDGTINYVRRESSFDGDALPVEARLEYLANTRFGMFGLTFDAIDTDLRGGGEKGLAVGAGFAFEF